MTKVDVQANLQAIKDTLPEHVTLVAVSKYHPNEQLLAAYEAGQRVFGESHEQELSKKHDTLPADIQWHFIGHLQTNKVKYIAPYITMIDAVDSVKLLKEINKQALKNNRVIDVLLELHIAQEATKYGFTLEACREYLASGEWRELNNVRICGMMIFLILFLATSHRALVLSILACRELLARYSSISSRSKERSGLMTSYLSLSR